MNEMIMNKIDSGANMKQSAGNPATAHTRDRYQQIQNEVFRSILWLGLQGMKFI
jgi:hypothetical protein